MSLIRGSCRPLAERFNGTKTSTSVGNVGSLFFPLTGRLGLRVESTASPLVERKMTIAGVVAESFPKAETYLQQLADIEASAQRIRRITSLRGRERLALRDHITDHYKGELIPDQLSRVPGGVTPPVIATISFDGGRYQVLDRSEAATVARAEQGQSGKRRKGQHWKESRARLRDVDERSSSPCRSDAGIASVSGRRSGTATQAHRDWTCDGAANIGGKRSC